MPVKTLANYTHHVTESHKSRPSLGIQLIPPSFFTSGVLVTPPRFNGEFPLMHRFLEEPEFLTCNPATMSKWLRFCHTLTARFYDQASLS